MLTVPAGGFARTGRRVLLLCALIAAGLAGNHFRYPILLNIDFLFGSIFALLALQALGLGRGIVATAMIASYTYVLWNHPYAIIIMTAEVAVVGLLHERRKIGLVLADTLYWLFIGMPLVFLFYYSIMHVSLSNAYITMTKQAMNGIANALAARLLFSLYTVISRTALLSYRETFCNMMLSFVLYPSLIILAIASRSDFVETDHQIRSKLSQDSLRVQDLVEAWVENRKSAIANLAERAASASPLQMQAHLELTRKSDPNFLRIGLLDRDATITAYSPLRDDFGQSNIGKNFADRPFIPHLKRTLKPMLSEVVMGRIGTPRPMVTVLAPVVMRGAYEGYVTGILSLERIRRHLDMSAGGSVSSYTLLDNGGKVIMTNRTDQTVMAPFARGNGTLRILDAGISQWVPTVPSNITISERWRRSSYIAEAVIGNPGGWTLILEQPVAPFQRVLYDRYAGHLARLLLLLLGAMVLAEYLSRRSISTIEKLRLITNDLPARLAEKGKVMAWPESSTAERAHLINNFREMAETLSARFSEIRQINASLEQRVEERTRELHAESARLQTLLETATDGIHVLDTDGNLVLWSPSFAQMLGYTAAEAATLNVADWDVQIPAQELGATIRELIRTPREFETRHRCKDGRELDVEISARGVQLGERTLLYASARDITRRKRAELELRESESNFRSFFETMTDLVWVCTPDGRILFANTAASRKLGYSPEEFTSMHVVAVHHADHQTEAEAILFEMLQGKRATCPLPLAHKDRSLVPVETRIWFGHWNGADCIFGISKDLTAEQEAKQRFERLFRNNPALMAVSNLNGRFLDVNDTFSAVTGHGRLEVLGKTSAELGLFVDQEHQAMHAGRLKAEGHLDNCEMQIRCKNGEIRDGIFTGDVIRSQGQESFLTVMIDVTERRRVESALREVEQRYRELVEYAPIGIFQSTPCGKYLEANKWLANIYGYDSAQELVEAIQDIGVQLYVDPEDRERVQASLEQGLAVELESLWQRRDGSEIWVAVSMRAVRDHGLSIVRHEGFVRDITRRKQLEEELRFLATTDPLTGIANRRHFLERTEEELTRSKRYGQPLVFLMLDIDLFKAVNDTFGHDAGDEVLKSLAATLHETLRGPDIFGRLGGEEFGVLLVQTDMAGGARIAERLRELLQCAHVATRSGVVRYSVSIGLAANLGKQDSVEALMKRADLALYAAKEAGRNRVCCYAEP